MSHQTWYRLVMALTRVSENLGVERVNRARGEDNEGLIAAYEVTVQQLSEEITRRLEEAERKEKDNG